jgi:hypothetical protein
LGRRLQKSPNNRNFRRQNGDSDIILSDPAPACCGDCGWPAAAGPIGLIREPPLAQ